MLAAQPPRKGPRLSQKKKAVKRLRLCRGVRACVRAWVFFYR